jgi:hypothetical protein
MCSGPRPIKFRRLGLIGPATRDIFESLREAVRFAMEELTTADRANIWITTEDGNLTIEQIEQLYSGLA